MNQLPDQIFVAVGAIAAAIITGIFSYINLVISKESKVSEFRQEWINELRKEISAYLSTVRTLIEKICDENMGKMLPKATIMASKTKYEGLYNELERTKTSILLRINTEEKKKKSKEMNNKFLEKVDEVSNKFESASFDEALAASNELVVQSRKLLKHEWNRARDGELGYKLSKYIALGTVVISLLLLGYVVFLKISPAKAAAPQENRAAVGEMKKENQKSQSTQKPQK